MDKSGEDAIPSLDNGICNARRRTRRRLVQSTLFGFESRENDECIDFLAEQDNEEEESNDSDSKAKRRKRKVQSKIPRKSPAKNVKRAEAKVKTSAAASSGFFQKVSEKKLQQKQQRNQQGIVNSLAEDRKRCKATKSMAGVKSHHMQKKEDVNPTPKKRSGNAKGSHLLFAVTGSVSDVAHDLDSQVPNMVVDLRLEAKVAAEDYARLSVGKQTHPFFSLWKAPKKIHDSLLESSALWSKGSMMQEDVIFTTSPIHVTDAPKDEFFSLDWDTWTFYGSSLLSSDDFSPQFTGSIFEDSVEPLKIDRFLINQNCNEESSVQNKLIEGKCSKLRTYSSLADRQETLECLLKFLKMVKQHEKVGLVAECTGSIDNLEDPRKLTILLERMLSCYSRCNNSDSSLWTNKYQPHAASEVCGNDDSVKSLSVWLQSWRERPPQTSKNDANDVGKCDVQDSDSWFENASDSENTEVKDTLKNVLLVTGPVGSGKSAAIYACAKEQGFHVIEVNASDWRNGTIVKQKFGEAMESHGFNRWSAEEHSITCRKPVLELSSTKPEGISCVDSDCMVVEAISITNEQEFYNALASRSPTKNKAGCSQGEMKTLILFEDVDIIFEEDKGFISTLLQIAETAKRPIILTSNSRDPTLPHILERLVVDFSVPSLEELISEAYMICTAEKVSISLQLLERFVRCCQGDIRKTITLLQFWCQGKVPQDKKIQATYSPLQFDLVACHHVIPVVTARKFSSQLSAIVEKEISIELSMAKESTVFLEDQELQKVMRVGNTLKSGSNRKASIKAKKEAMLQRNCFAHERNGFVSQCLDLNNLCNSPGSPITFHQAAKRKLMTVFSSDSESDRCPLDNPAGKFVRRKLSMILNSDSEDSIDELSRKASIQKYNVLESPNLGNGDFCTYNHSSMLHILPLDSNCEVQGDGPIKSLDQGIIAPSYSENPLYQEQQRSFIDISCVPESSFVPDTNINEVDCLSKSISGSHFDVSFESVAMGDVNNLPMNYITSTNRTTAETNNYSDNTLEHIFFQNIESVHGNEDVIETCQTGNGEILAKEYAIMDECSRAEFSAGFYPMGCLGKSLQFDFMQKSGKKQKDFVASDAAKEAWRKLRSRQEDLKIHVTSEEKDVAKILKFMSGLTTLVSDGDVMLNRCQPFIDDTFEPNMVPGVEPDSFSWHDLQLEMASTYAQHGFCLFSERMTSVERDSSIETKVGLAQKMLAFSSSIMAQGKLVVQEMGMISNFCDSDGNEDSLFCSSKESQYQRETEPNLYNLVVSLMPRKSRLGLKGPALHEYLSTLSQISRLETSRIQESHCRRRQHGRAYTTRHYLSSGALALSSEEVALLDQHGCFGEVRLKSNCT